MTSKIARASKSRSLARKTRVPSLIYSHANGHDYALVRWQGRSFSMGRADDPELDTRYRVFVSHLLAHGTPPLQAGETARTPSYCVAELVAHYLNHAEVYYRLPDGTQTSTVNDVRSAVKPLLELFGAVQARDFNVAMLRTYRDRIVETGNTRAKCNAKVQIVRRMFAWAGEEGRLEPEVGLRLTVLKHLQRGRSKAHDLPPRQPVAWEHVEPVLPYLPRQVAAIIKVLWWSGARCGEVCQLRGRELDTRGAVWAFRPPRHKTQHHGKTRLVDFGERAQQELRPFVKLDPDAYWFSPADAVAEFQAERRAARKTPLHPSHQRRKAALRKPNPKRAPRPFYDSQAVGQALRKAIDATNAELERVHIESGARGKPPRVPSWTSHQLRHAALTRIRAEFGLEVAQAVGGHGCFGTTEIYTGDAVRELARRAAAKIG